MSFTCPEANCGRKFTRRNNLNRHYQNFHLNNNVVEKCIICGQIFQDCNDLQRHYRHSHRPSRYFVLKQSAFRKNLVRYVYTFNDNEVNFAASQLSIEKLLHNLLVVEAAKRTICKVNLVLIAEMIMLDGVGDEMMRTGCVFRAPNFLANAAMPGNITKNIRSSFLHQQKSLEEYQKNSSNWQFSRSLAFDVEIAALSPIVVGSNESNNRKRKLNTYHNTI